MTTTDRIKWFRDYFNVQMSEADFRKCEEMLKAESIETIVEKIIYREKVVYKKIKQVNIKEGIQKFHDGAYMLTLLQNICQQIGINYLTCFTKDRTATIVRAKVWFCRTMKFDFPDVTCIELAEFLKCDHTTVIHYWNTCKIDCPIMPFPVKRRKQQATIDKIKRQTR